MNAKNPKTARRLVRKYAQKDQSRVHFTPRSVRHMRPKGYARKASPPKYARKRKPHGGHRITEDSPRWNARTMGNHTGIQKVSKNGYAVYFRGRQIGHLRDRQSAESVMRNVLDRPYRSFGTQPRGLMFRLGRPDLVERQLDRLSAEEPFHGHLRSEDDYPTWMYARPGGRFQTKRGGKGSTTLGF